VDRGDHQAGHVARERRLSGRHPAQCAEQARTTDLLLQEAVRAGGDRLEHRLARRVERPHDQMRATAPASARDELEPAASRQVEVDERDLRVAAEQQRGRFLDVGCFEELEVALAPEEASDPDAEEGKPVGDEDASAPHERTIRGWSEVHAFLLVISSTPVRVAAGRIVGQIP
jgi:hypothetical protein